MNKDELLEMEPVKALAFIGKTTGVIIKGLLKEFGVKVLSNQKVEDLRTTLLTVYTSAIGFGTKNDELVDSNSEEQLKKRAATILEKAAEINSALSDATPEERDTMIQEFDSQMDLGGILTKYFPSIQADAADAPLASDLPFSTLLANLPVRIVEQEIKNSQVAYALLALTTQKVVKNGILQLFYKDYRDTDGTSGSSDVVIGDYNGGVEPTFTEVFGSNTHIHKGLDILDNMLNDVTVTVGLFIALIKDMNMAIARPFNKRMYERFVTFLDSDAAADTGSYDEIVEFAAADDIKTKAKAIFNKLTSVGTTSRNNLKKLPKGATEALEYRQDPAQSILIIDTKYAADYKYDLTAGTFQLGEIKLPVSKVVTVDFSKVAEYSKATVKHFANREAILYTNGAYIDFRHYDGSKMVNTPKLKQVFHRYMKAGNARDKSKLMIAFDVKAA